MRPAGSVDAAAAAVISPTGFGQASSVLAYSVTWVACRRVPSTPGGLLYGFSSGWWLVRAACWRASWSFAGVQGQLAAVAGGGQGCTGLCGHDWQWRRNARLRNLADAVLVHGSFAAWWRPGGTVACGRSAVDGERVEFCSRRPGFVSEPGRAVPIRVMPWARAVSSRAAEVYPSIDCVLAGGQPGGFQLSLDWPVIEASGTLASLVPRW